LEPLDLESVRLTREEEEVLVDLFGPGAKVVVPTIPMYPVPTCDMPASESQVYPDWDSKTSRVVKFSAKKYSRSQARFICVRTYGRVFESISDGATHQFRVPRTPIKEA
jgi:hypothetical protein